MTLVYSYVISPTILVTGSSGKFFSINFPSNYQDSYEEHYIISVKDGSKISLMFENFDLEYHMSCIYDYVEGDKNNINDVLNV